MFKEFREFIARGNVLDLAVAVVIGGAFGAIVASFTEDLLMPLIAAIFGQPDFSSMFVRLGPIPPGFEGDPSDYAALKEAGVAMFGWGAFLTALINFLIIAFALFFVVKAANRVSRKEEAPPPGPSEEVLLLREIRDGLKKP
ncbi:MAG: large conductance mechanosensitive channel protein MscL [Thermaurantiacus sp.]